jgi:hypothetical protein
MTPKPLYLETGRVGNFRQKNNSAEDGIDGTMVISDGIPAVPRNRKLRNSVPNRSAEQKTTRNSVLWNKNRSKLLEFPSEPFRGRETTRNSVPRIEKYKQTLGIPFRTITRKRKQLAQNAAIRSTSLYLPLPSPLTPPPMSPVLNTCNIFFVAVGLDCSGFLVEKQKPEWFYLQILAIPALLNCISAVLNRCLL